MVLEIVSKTVLDNFSWLLSGMHFWCPRQPHIEGKTSHVFPCGCLCLGISTSLVVVGWGGEEWRKKGKGGTVLRDQCSGRKKMLQLRKGNEGRAGCKGEQSTVTPSIY